MATFDDRWRGLDELGDGLGMPEDDSPAERAAARSRRAVRPDEGRREGKATKIANATGIALGRLGTGLIDSAVRGVMAPGNAYRSTADNPVTTEQMVGPAFDLASTLMGGAPGTAQTGALGIFGGRGARTADLSALARAEKMAAEGASREAIWSETGWFQGTDKKWRFEIDDTPSAIREKAMEELTRGTMHGATQRTAPGVLAHDPLYAAYPELRQIDVDARWNVDLAHPSGRYHNPENRGGRPEIKMDLNAIAGDTGPRSLMLHELQHPIQNLEGFGRGASVGEYARGPMFDRRARDLNGDLSKEITGSISTQPAELFGLLRYGDPGTLEKIAQRHGFDTLDQAVSFLRAQDVKRTPFDQYRRTAGEVEARNVQRRRNMTADERRETPPWVTEDVPASEQIVRYLDEAGPQESRLLDPYQTNFNVLDNAEVFKRLAQKRRDQGLGNGGPGAKAYPSAKARAAAEGYTAPEKGSWGDLVQRTKAQWDHDKSAARADYQAAANPLMSADDLAFIDSPGFSLFAGAADKRSAAAITGTRAASDRGHPLDHATLVRHAGEISAQRGGFSAAPIADLVRATGLPPRVVHDALLREARAGNVTLHPTTVAIADYPAAERAAWLKLDGFDAPFVTFSLVRREPRTLDDLDELLRSYRAGRDDDADPLAAILDGSK